MRRSLGIRFRLFVATMVMILAVEGVTGFYLDRSLRSWLVARTESALLAQTHTISEAITSRGAQDDEGLHAQVQRLADAAEVRITVIRVDGLVLSDSEVEFTQLPSVENHAERPEVVQAWRQGQGVARRHSATVGEDLVYAAVPVRRQDSTDVVVRTAVPLVVLSEAGDRLRLFLGIGGLLGLVMAIALSLLASFLMSRALLRLVENARALAQGQGDRIELDSPDELGRLAVSFNRVMEQTEQTMATLAAERSRFETILESMSEAVLVLDAQQKITLVNPATSNLLNVYRVPLGEPLSAVIRAPELEDLAQAGIVGPAAKEFSLDGPVVRQVLARAQPLPLSGGTVIVMHDVTDMRRLETIRKDFVANVSHELRTPVSIIRANSETLLDGALDDPDRARSFVDALHRNSERLSRIISDLLDLSRIEAGRHDFDYQAVDVGAAVSRVVESVRTKAHQRRVSIDVAVEEDVRVWADAKAIDQSLLNLLDNSIKYTPDGGHVSIRAEERDGQVRIEIQDDGPGIKPEHRIRIFERFYRIDPGRSRDMGGTGLGLAIVKHFMDSMSGAVGVDPAFPRGSTFWLTLPAAPAQEDASATA